MNILHVLSYSLPIINGYTIRSKYIVEFEKALGLNPSVITSPKYSHEDPYISETKISEIPYYRTKMKNNRLTNITIFKEYILTRVLSKEILRVVKEKRISLIHAHSSALNGLAALKASKRFNIPLIYELRATWEDAAVESSKTKIGSLKYNISRFLEQKVITQSNAVVTISEHLKQDLINRGIDPEKISVVPNGVDTRKFTPSEKKDEELLKRYDLKDKIVLGFIGSFFRFEGLTYLVRAFADILNRYKDARLLLIGEGEEKDEIIRLSRGLKIENEIVLPGRVSHNEILRHYSIIDIFVYPRIRTRLTEIVTPLKPLEAMSMGKGVIASDVGGLKELITDGEDGLLFRAEDIHDLVDKCFMMINNGARENGLREKTRRKMIETRDWSKISRKYLNLYNQILESSCNNLQTCN